MHGTHDLDGAKAVEPAGATVEPAVDFQAAPPVALPMWPGRRFVDLIAESIREVATRDSHAVFQMMANAIVQHMAAGARASDRGESVDMALDSMLSLISPELQQQVSGPQKLPAQP